MAFEGKPKRTRPDPRKQIVNVKSRLHSGRPKAGGFKIEKPRDVINSTRAKKLLTTIYKSQKTKRNYEKDPNYHKGINIFALLSRELSDNTRLDKVLDWYCANYKDEHTPLILDVHHFRNKFFRLEDAMKRHAQRNPVLVISAAARRLFKHMGYHRITTEKGPYSLYKTAFLNLCEICHANVTDTFDWVHDEYHFENELPDSIDFCITYLNEMQDWVCDKYQTDEWWKHINPIDIAFRSKTKRFANAMRKWGKAVHIEQELIDEIIKGVNECVSMK